jgi:hypothetical protein
MAPTSDELHDLVAKLEARVKHLEQKLLESSGGAPRPTGDEQSIRMILIGPPGAGMSVYKSFFVPLPLSRCSRCGLL